jgi:hypothetical protein
VPITDPAEIAELEARIKPYEDSQRAARIRESAWLSKRTTVAELLELAGLLSGRSRVQLITRLAAQLPAKEQAELIKQLLGKHPVDGRQRVR